MKSNQEQNQVVTKWLMAAQISDDYQKAPVLIILYHMPHIGRKGLWDGLHGRLRALRVDLTTNLYTMSRPFVKTNFYCIAK